MVSSYKQIRTVHVQCLEPLLFLHTHPALTFILAERGYIFSAVELHIPAHSVPGNLCTTGGIGEAAFCDITRGARYEEIDSLACFPFTNIRHNFQSGVLRFVSKFFKAWNYKSGACGWETGMWHEQCNCCSRR